MKLWGLILAMYVLINEEFVFRFSFIRWFADRLAYLLRRLLM